MTEPATSVPDTTWTDVALLAEYNKYSTTQRRARFSSKELALSSIARAKRDPADTPPPAAAKKTGRREHDKLRKLQKRSPKNVRARMANLTIKIIAEANPYRDADETIGRKESKAHAHYEKMRGGITVLNYLAKFTEQDQKNARQYLWNAIQDGHVKTVGA